MLARAPLAPGHRAVEQGLQAALEPVVEQGGIADRLGGRIAGEPGGQRELAGAGCCSIYATMAAACPGSGLAARACCSPARRTWPKM